MDAVSDARVNLNPKHRTSRGDGRMMTVMVIRHGGRKERQERSRGLLAAAGL